MVTPVLSPLSSSYYPATDHPKDQLHRSGSYALMISVSVFLFVNMLTHCAEINKWFVTIMK